MAFHAIFKKTFNPAAQHAHRHLAPGVLLASLLAATGCTIAAESSICREPSADCICESSHTPAADAVTIITDGDSPQVGSIIEALATVSMNHEPPGLLGLEADPAVTVATYDALGQVTPHGRYLLGGEGASPKRKEARAEFNAACLKALALPTPGAGDLPRALPDAVALAQDGQPERSAVIAIGLGRTDGEAFEPLQSLDLTTGTLRQAVADNYDALRYLPHAPTTRILFWRPADGVTHPIAAASITALAVENLCGVIENCAVLRSLEELEETGQ